MRCLSECDADRCFQPTADSDESEELKAALPGLAAAAAELRSRTSFEGELKQAAEDFERMRANDKKLHDDAAKRPFTCTARGMVQVDLGLLQTNLGTLQSDRGMLEVRTRRVQDGVAEVQQRIGAVRSGWQSLEAATTSNTSGVPTPAYSMDDVNNAVAAAQQQVTASRQQLQDAQAQFDTMYKEAAGLADTEKNFVAALAWSG